MFVSCVLQTVNMQFAGGATATMSMIAFTKAICARKVRIFGTKVCICKNFLDLFTKTVKKI